MPLRSALVITSISAPNPVLTACAEGSRKHDIDFIVRTAIDWEKRLAARPREPAA